MNDLSQGLAALLPGAPYHVVRDGVRATELGPFAYPIRIQLRAYSHHSGGGDGSTAWAKLYYDNVLVADRTDHSFNNANFDMNYAVDIDAGNTANFRIESGNSGATEDSYGFEFWLSRAPV